jgi:hypothetical protein
MALQLELYPDQEISQVLVVALVNVQLIKKSNEDIVPSQAKALSTTSILALMVGLPS